MLLFQVGDVGTFQLYFYHGKSTGVLAEFGFIFDFNYQVSASCLSLRKYLYKKWSTEPYLVQLLFLAELYHHFSGISLAISTFLHLAHLHLELPSSLCGCHSTIILPMLA